MGALFAFGFAIIIGFCGSILLVVGLLLRKRIKILSVVSFVFSGICFLPIAFFIVLICFSVVDQHNMKKDYAKENGRLFAELVYGGGKHSILREVLQTDNLNVLNKNGESPLYIVCTRDSSYLSIAKKMIEKGADPNFANADGKIPLHVALSQLEKVKFLIESGSYVNKQNDDGYTPLMRCVEMSKFYGNAEELVDILISSGSDTTLKNNDDEDCTDILRRLMREEKEDYEKDLPNFDYQESKNYKLIVHTAFG